MKTLAIGKQKVFTDVTLEVVPSKYNDCIDCWFYYQPGMCINHPHRSIMGSCVWLHRADGKNVIFKEVKGKEVV